MTLDVIKSKAQSLMVENNGFQVEYRKLTGQLQQLRHSIDEQQNKNEQMASFLKERHGRTDQQVRVEELTQIIKTKKQEIRNFDDQWGQLNRMQEALNHRIQQAKNMISHIELRQQMGTKEVQAYQNSGQAPGDDQLMQLRTQLEDENRKEVLLEDEWGSLKTGDKTQNLNVDAVNEQNKKLEARLGILRLQILRHNKESSGRGHGQTNARKYEQLKKRKDLLMAKINAYELRLDELRESLLTSLSWKERKKGLVREMVQTDARNNQIRDNIKVLREDIDVLRDQVARLERRLDFVQGKDTKQ